MAEWNTEPDSMEKGSDFETYEIQNESSRKEIEDDVEGFLSDPVKVKSFLSCEKCKQNFDVDKLRPLLLPCLSAICKQCVQALWASNDTFFKCSLCHCVHTCIEKGNILLPEDSTREGVMQFVRLRNGESNLTCEMCTSDEKATNRCFDCSCFICFDCTKLHSSLRPLQNHTFIPIKNLLAGEMESLNMLFCTTYCPVQGHEKEVLKGFCFTKSCMKAVCILCATSTHQNHIIRDIAEVVHEKRNQIKKAKDSIQLLEEQSHVFLKQLTEMNEKNLNQSTKLQKEIIVCFDEAKKMLDQRAKELCDAVRAKQSERETMFDMEKKRLDIFFDSCTLASRYLNIAPVINNHQCFLNVSNSMEMRLEGLESQALRNQISVTTDSMKFLPKELDLSFKDIVKGFGKLLVSKACSLKCKAVVESPVCDVGEAIAFQITLVSSLGRVLDDEDVKVSLKYKGQTLKLIECLFEKSSQRYVGNWTPNVPTTISWNVISNGIELETLRGDLHVKNTVSNYDNVDTETPTTTPLPTVEKQLFKIPMNIDQTETTDFQVSQDKSRSVCSKFLNEEQQLTATKGRINSSESMPYIIKIPLSERDFNVFFHFGAKCRWFKRAENEILYDGHNLTCVVSADEGEILDKKMKEHLAEIRMMTTDQIVLADNRGVNIHQLMQDIGREYPNVCLLLKDNTVEIICDSYTDLLKIKGLLLQKMSGKVNRRARRNAANREETLLAGDTYIRRLNTDGNFQTEFQSDGAGRTMPHIKFESKTKEGLKIKIYEGSITRLDIDCIVNAANENLMHGAGVAAAISEAAGYAFDDESKDYIAIHGPIPVGTCAVTSAGKLPYKHVIHTVGPRWNDYSDKDRCLKDLCESVEVTFRKADKLGMMSIALSAISTGLSAVPRDKCVQQHYKAVMTFSRSYPFQSLKEIHFVDRDTSMVSAIQSVFQQRDSSTSCLDTTGSPEAPGNGKTLPADNSKSSSIHQRSQLNKQLTTADSIIKVSDMLTIKVHLGNITDVTVDIVVCPQDEYCSSKGQVARGILKLIPSESEAPCAGRKKIGQIMSQKIYGNSPWKMIIHAVTPRWNSKSAKDPGTFERTLNIMIQEILKNADDSKYLSIAVPLLGAGVDGYSTPMETCSRNFYRAVRATHSKLKHLKEIYLVLKEETAEKAYLDTFKDGGFQVIFKSFSEFFQSRKKTNLGKTMKSSDLSQEQEACCICIDTPTNPKRLKKCGHIFCKECIEQYFEYTPACPSCGQIYGKMKGDQPPGSISMRKSNQGLEGFNDCHTCIIVTYILNSGSQGSEHPNPGRWYKGICRSGYVPNNEKGRLVAKLLNVAFSRQLVFTIGRSRTTGQDGVVIWNGIHHKTRPDGGPQKFGYPDDTYLDRVLEELAAKGVTPESADYPEEYSEYSKLFRCN